MFDSLTIKNFGLHEATEIDFEAPVALFVGPNEHGKSTIRQAARFLLDGYVVDEELLTVLQKQLYGHFIRNPKDAGQARNLNVAGVVKVNGKNYDLTRKQTAKTASGSPALDLDRDVLNCLFNSKYYARMKTADRAKLWFRVLGLQMDLETLKKEVSKRVPSASVIDRRDLSAIYLYFEKAGFDRAETAAVEMRREFKRAIEALPKDPPAATTEIEFTKDGRPDVKEIKFSEHTMEGVEATLAHEKSQQLELQTARAKLEGRESQSAEYVRTALAEAFENIKELETEISGMKSTSPDLEVMAEKVDAAAEAWKAVRVECKDLEHEIGSIADLPDWSEHCPIYGDDVKCKSKTQIEKMLSDRRKSLGGLKRSRTSKLKKHDDLKADFERLAAEQNQAGESALLFVEKTGRLAYYQEDVRRLEKLKKDAKPFSTKDKEKLAGLARDIENVKNRRAALGILLDRLIAYHDAVAVVESAEKLESDLQGKINAADDLAVALGSGPKGIRASLTKKARSEVNALLTYFDKLLGRSVALDDNLAVTLGDVPYEHLLSHSARRRLGIAIQAAIASLTGIKFFAVDDLENLDPVRRNDMLATAINLAHNFKFQIWMLCSLGVREVELLQDALPIGGLEIFMVANGKVSKMEGKQ